MLEPVAFRVVIRPDPVMKKTKSGILLATDEKLEQNATQRGTIVALGPDVYTAFKTAIPFGGLKVGQRVDYAKYSGKWSIDPETSEQLLVVNDEDITTIVKGEAKDELSAPDVETQSS